MRKALPSDILVETGVAAASCLVERTVRKVVALAAPEFTSKGAAPSADKARTGIGLLPDGEDVSKVGEVSV
jgi:hypothetical protein